MTVEPPAATPTRVLIVEDDVPTRIGLDTILSAEIDIEVIGHAATGLEGCEMAEALSPDVVLMDIQLPELDGIEATRRITARDRDAAAPRVIVVTTYDYDEYVYRSLRAGASGFLLKRTRAEDLVDAVRAVAGGDALPLASTTRGLIADFAARTPGVASEWRAVSALTDRESEVLTLVARGLSNDEIAERLSLSIETVKTHVKHVYTKLGTRDRAQAVIAAYESGLVSPGTAPA
jgi:DNA-binding NarL/FixJ family response regulator